MRRDDRDNFAATYDEHVYDVDAFLGYRVQTREEAEDLTQQTFEKALRAWRRFDPKRASAKTWLISIARNLLIDHYRRDRAVEKFSIGPGNGEVSEEALGTVDPPEVGISPELDEALADLSDQAREVIALRFGADMSGPEIAAFTGLSVANVHQLLSRSLRRMEARLEERGEASSRPLETPVSRIDQ